MKVELIKAITKELRLKPGLHRSGRKESVIADFLTVVILQLIRQGWAFNNVEGRWCSSQTQRTTLAHKLWFRFETVAFLSMGYIESLSHRCSMLRASLLAQGKRDLPLQAACNRRPEREAVPCGALHLSEALQQGPGNEGPYNLSTHPWNSRANECQSFAGLKMVLVHLLA